MRVRSVFVLLAIALLGGCANVQLLGTGAGGGQCSETPHPELAAYLGRIQAAWRGAEIHETAMLLQASAAGAAFAGGPTSPAEALRSAFAASRSRPFSGPVPSLQETLALQDRVGANDVRTLIGDARLPLERPTLAANRSALRLRSHLSRLVPPALDAIDRVERTAAAGQPELIHTVEPKGDLLQALTEVAQTGGDDALLWQAAAEAEALIDTSSARTLLLTPPAQIALVTDLRSRAAEIRYAKFLGRYLGAYFRGGRVFQAKLKIDDVAAEFNKHLAAVNPPVQEPALSAIKKGILDALTKVCKDNNDTGCLLTSPLGEQTLVLRHGSSIGFSGVTLTVGYDSRVVTTWDYPKSAEFAPQLVRVAVEALFDSLTRHPPGLPTALACMKDEMFRRFDPKLPFAAQAPECLSEEVIAGAPGLQDAVANVDDWAARADSVAAVGIGMFVRGGYWAALNNETAARSVENLGGVIARKVAEHVAWTRTVELGCSIGKPPLLLQIVGG